MSLLKGRTQYSHEICRNLLFCIMVIRSELQQIKQIDSDRLCQMSRATTVSCWNSKLSNPLPQPYVPPSKPFKHRGRSLSVARPRQKPSPGTGFDLDADADAESQQVLELNCFSFKVSDQQEVGGKWRHLAEGGSSIQAPPTDGAWALTKIPRTSKTWFVGKFTHIILVGDSTCTCVCCWSGRGVAGRYGWNVNSNRHPVTPQSPLASTFTSRPTR